MTFKTNLPAASCPALSGFGVIVVSGLDAPGFLQAQLMNDVATLAPGQWQWSGWLTPKGRVIALLALVRLDDDRFLIVTPDMPGAELAVALRRYVFRSKVVFDDASTWVAAAGPAVAPPAPGHLVGDPAQGLALDLGDHAQPRSLWLLPADSPALAAADPVVDASWKSRDLAYGLPRLPASQREAWTPQMLSLERLAAYSLKKGCYPGQEIVARTHFLGKAKRRLVLLGADAPLAEGSPVRDGEGREVGTLVSVVNAAAGTTALAVLPADLPGEAALESGPALTPMPLSPGLAR